MFYAYSCLTVAFLLDQNFLFTSKEENSQLKAIDFGLSDFVKPGFFFFNPLAFANFSLSKVAIKMSWMMLICWICRRKTQWHCWQCILCCTWSSTQSIQHWGWCLEYRCHSIYTIVRKSPILGSDRVWDLSCCYKSWTNLRRTTLAYIVFRRQRFYQTSTE